MRFDHWTPDRIKTRHTLVARHLAWHASMSRRTFLRAGVGASVVGGALGLGLLRPVSALAAPGIGNVLPIPTTEDFLGVELHVQSPPFTGEDTDPSGVWNFQGASGIAFIDTTVTRTNRKTGAREVLPSSNHMNGHQGIYVGRDGHVREITFAFVWIDIFSLGGEQLHDFNPGITQNGLFWIVVLPADTVDVDLDAGTATLEVHDLHVTDDYTFENSVLHNLGRPSTPAVVSFRVVWTATGGVNVFDNAAQQFRGEFRNASAQMEYSARAGKFEFQSDPLASSTTVAAELGRESNGSFY
jgi:hypothetical protein